MPRTKSFLRRVSQASWKELSTRGRQEFSKRLDYVLFCALKGRFASTGFGVATSGPRGRFFFSPDDIPSICCEMHRRFPEAVVNIQNCAEQICSHHFSLLGYENLSLGKQIDWHADSVHSKRAPLKPWFKIHYLDFDEVGDSKITWELSRHQHLVTLARAYLLTKESRYADKLFDIWHDWHRQNPYPIGINWSSSLEVAFRTLSWIWIDYLLQGAAIVPIQFSKDLVETLALNGRHIETYLSTYFSPNTHLLGEATALFFLGILYPGMRNADRWKRKGWKILEQQAIQQVQSDGMHFEQSVHYHVYALDFFLHARILASRNGVHVSSGFDQTIVSMLEVLCTLSQAGPIPRLGDDDGGRLFDPSRNQAEHMLDPLCTGAALFGRADLKEAGRPCEETLWLLGTEGMRALDRLPDAKGHFSSALPASGVYVMSSSAGEDQQLTIDAGPLGSGRAGHGHADALSLHLSVGGHELLTDPGTYSYVSAEMDRSLFRGTRAHNTLQIDGADQAESDGPFGWRALPHVTVEAWEQGRNSDFLIASRADRTFHTPVHQRMIFYLKPSFWFIRDRVDGGGSHSLDLFWHFAPGLEVMGDKNSLIGRPVGTQQGLWMLFCADAACDSRIEDDYCSPSYGKAVRSSTLHVSGSMSLPGEFATILVPIPNAKAAAGSLAPLNFESEPELRSYVFCTSGESHYFIFNNSGREWKTDSWSSDAQFLYCAFSSGKTLIRWAAFQASFLVAKGSRLFSDSHSIKWREWTNEHKMQSQEPCEERSSTSEVLLHADNPKDR